MHFFRHGTACLLAVCGLVLGTAEARSDIRTFIDGQILFRDEGREIETPYSVSAIQGLLTAQTRNFDDPAKIEGGAPVRVWRPRTMLLFPSEFVVYEVKLGTRYTPPFVLQIDFNYDGFEVQERLPLPRHLGGLPYNLVIEREMTRGERQQQVNDGLDAPDLRDPDISRILRLIEGLVNDPRAEGDSADAFARYLYEDYFRAVVLMQRVMQQGAVLSPDIANRILDLPRQPSFRTLSAEQQFAVLSGFAYWFARSPTPDQQVQGNLTHAGIATDFFEDAYNLARDTNNTDHSVRVPAKDLIEMLQGRYQLACKTPRSSTCFYALHDAGSFDRDFSADTHRTVLMAFHTHLENASRPETAATTECAYRRQIATERDDIVLYWEHYANLADAIATKHSEIKTELEPDRGYKTMTNIARTRDRARDIVALARAEDPVSRSCAPAPAVLPDSAQP